MIEEMMQEGKTTNPRGFGGKELPDDDNNQASPEEQADYDMLVIRARKVIFGKGKEKVLKLLGTGESPAQSMGQAASMIMKMMISTAKDQGKEIGPEVAVNAGTEIVEDLNDLAKKKGVFEYDSPEDEKEQLADAVLWGVKYYGDGMIKTGELSPEMQQMGQKVMQEGIEGEQSELDQKRSSKAPKKTKVAEAVGSEMDAMGGGLIGRQMGGM